MIYKYIAKNQDGTEIKGDFEANSPDEVIKNLQKQDLMVVKVSGQNALDFKFLQKKVSLKDKIIFTRQLAIMVRGGLPLVEALQALKEQTENPKFNEVIEQIKKDVSGGTILSAALTKHKDIFPDYYIAVVSSGEKSGKLDKVLESLADQLQKDYDLISKVKSAVSYPIVVVCALIGIMILMLIFVIPKLKTIFSEMGVALPLPTRILLGTSDFMVHQWYIVLAIVLGIYFGSRFWFRTPRGNLVIDTFKIKVPIFGKLVTKIYLTRFSRTTATLIASGLPMLEIIETDKKVIANRYFDPIFNSIRKDIESGISFSAALKKHSVFPPMIAHMVSVGEQSGKIDDILNEVSDFYDKEVEATTEGMASLIEPILIILIGAGIGVAIASVIMPIYSLVNVI